MSRWRCPSAVDKGESGNLYLSKLRGDEKGLKCKKHYFLCLVDKSTNYSNLKMSLKYNYYSCIPL